jgi:hypothetical protein
MTEKEISIELEYTIKKLGGDELSFSPIVASGLNGALPHAIPTDKKVQNGELLVLDFGTSLKGYASDMTRTVAVGKISDKLLDMYNTTLNAQLSALEKIKSGKACKEIHNVAQEIIDKKYQSHSEYFNTEFFKRCICYTILYRETDRIVNKAEWYNVGGYKLNIVPYTISKIMSAIPTGYALDFDRIWRKQELYPSLVAEINRIAQITNMFIQKSSGVIVTEYCKKEDTWNKYKVVPCTFSQEFISDLMPLSIIEDKMKAEMKSEKLGKELNIEGEIVNLGGAYRKRIAARTHQR